MGCPLRDLTSSPEVHVPLYTRCCWVEQNKYSYLLGQFKSLHHNNSCTLIPLIARNLAGWTFVCPLRNLVHPAPENNHGILIVLRYSADPLKAVSGLRLVPYPRAILKIRPPSSLDYRARHGPQTTFTLCYALVKIGILYEKPSGYFFVSVMFVCLFEWTPSTKEGKWVSH